MKQWTNKHKCKFCPYYKYLSHLEIYACHYNWDGDEKKIITIPSPQCRCRFGKEWFHKNIHQ